MPEKSPAGAQAGPCNFRREEVFYPSAGKIDFSHVAEPAAVRYYNSAHGAGGRHAAGTQVDSTGRVKGMLFSIMHVIHLLTVIIWIGGLAFVTTMVLPMAIKDPDPLGKVLTFSRVERRFAPSARWYNLITGASGLVMMLQTGWYRLLFTKEGLPLTFMVLVWVFWFVMLFGLEPIIIKKMLERMKAGGEKMEIETVFARMNRLHWIMLLVSLTAAAAGAVTAHGPFFG